MDTLEQFIRDQLAAWPMAAENFASLAKIRTAEFTLDGLDCVIQYNPARRTSSTAEVDAESIASRPCFLCAQNRPREQYHLPYTTARGRAYRIQVNPFPIFPNHLVIVQDEHCDQQIRGHLADLMEFAAAYPDHTFYYNGPQAGASAPDHMHFQAIPRKSLPLERGLDDYLNQCPQPASTLGDAALYCYPHFHRGIRCLQGRSPENLEKLFFSLPGLEGEYSEEPLMNVYAWMAGEQFRLAVCLRKAMRSHHYYSPGDEKITVTCGAAEMAGVVITPEESDLQKITPAIMGEMFDEICL